MKKIIIITLISLFILTIGIIVIVNYLHSLREYYLPWNDFDAIENPEQKDPLEVCKISLRLNSIDQIVFYKRKENWGERTNNLSRGAEIQCYNAKTSGVFLRPTEKEEDFLKIDKEELVRIYEDCKKNDFLWKVGYSKYYLFSDEEYKNLLSGLPELKGRHIIFLCKDYSVLKEGLIHSVEKHGYNYNMENIFMIKDIADFLIGMRQSEIDNAKIALGEEVFAEIKKEIPNFDRKISNEHLYLYYFIRWPGQILVRGLDLKNLDHIFGEYKYEVQKEG
jgi:hypothetical protein